MDVSNSIHFGILLLGVLIGLLIAWSPRLVVYRLHKRLAELEFTLLSDRNKKAAAARWKNPEDDPLMRELLKKNKEPDEKFANDF